MQTILNFLQGLPWGWIIMSLGVGFAALVATAPLVIGIIGQRRANACLRDPAARRIYEDGQFYDIAEGNDLIELDYSNEGECLVTVNTPWAVDPLYVRVFFKTTDNPDLTGKNCPSQGNSAPHDQWAQKAHGGRGYVVYVFPGVRLSRVVIHIDPTGQHNDQVELVFDQGWETRILFPL